VRTRALVPDRAFCLHDLAPQSPPTRAHSVRSARIGEIDAARPGRDDRRHERARPERDRGDAECERIPERHTVELAAMRRVRMLMRFSIVFS
jgi:hypothetical protein